MPANEEFWRRPSRMHVVFAISALVLTFATVLMLVKDYDDEWRVYQREFSKKDAERAEREEKAIADKAYLETEANLKGKLKDAEDDVKSRQAEVDEIEKEIAELSTVTLALNRSVKFKRAERDKARADYDLAISKDAPKARQDQLKEIFDSKQAIVSDMEQELDEQTAALNNNAEVLKELRSAQSAAKEELKDHTEDFVRIQGDRLAKEPESWVAITKKTFVNVPLLDLNPTNKIQQIWLPDLTINLGGMKDVPRFDRCITCHLATDRVGAGNVPDFPESEYPHPFATHPRTDLFITASSPHSQAKFGCTICHDGQGSGTSFHNASHTPNDPVIAAEWKKEYEYFHNHFWENPMYPDRFKESTCLKCHHGVTELAEHPKFGASAPKVVDGWETVEKFGCFGCHEIRGYDGLKSIGPDLRLEPSTPEQAAKIAEDPNAIPGKLRKVGPSLRHIKSKVTTGWTQVWVEEPKSFRPSTRMPQFFHLSNQQDEVAKKYSPVEIAGTVAYLMSRSEAFDELSPEEGYTPEAERGKQTFATRGCLNCHNHADFPESQSDFGPDLTKVHEKLLPGEAGFRWLYTWIREPSRYHARTKMPDLFLDPEVKDGVTIDPAADIAAYLQQGGSKNFGMLEWNGPGVEADKSALDEMVQMFLAKAISLRSAKQAMIDGKLPENMTEETIKGDEIELFGETITEEMKLRYIGRRTISRYGCYGCHDIPGFEDARPIGTALQDWGRKDPSKLAFEHIGEYLHHFGEPNGSSTAERAKLAVMNAENESFPADENPETELAVAYFYDQINHHGRPGFAWQKLRAPRSYDYRKIETKGYDERLRMPKFPFSEEENEAVVTFVLGLTADPPESEYVYTPTGPDKDRLEGEKLLKKYNCTGCHMVDMPEILAAIDPEELLATDTSGEYPEALELLYKLKPIHQGETGETMHLPATEYDEARDLPVISFHGMATATPDPDDAIEDQEYSFQLWEPLQVGETLMLPSEPMLVPAQQLVSNNKGRGGEFARFLVKYLVEQDSQLQSGDAWQMSPPPLYQEGIKVQTPWLYKFLKNPDRLRFSTVLRMPKFNMSDEEALVLANYFAAVNGAEYPYQDIPQREPEYLSIQNAKYPHYLEESWKLFNIPRPDGLCVKCHQFGGMEYTSTDPKDKRGPNLNRVESRLRPDWTLLWISNPKWITPYTAMPQNFKKATPQFPQFFGGEGDVQTRAIRDALMNYHRMMEQNEKVAGSETAPGQAGGQ
ncbi:Cytochrome c [Symmachiella macrocystis]|uniref:Cytochrome c n=1 Tax=Symmachiella macrocystis TaxID=2527985 RepID=A0A5C6BBC4_9PLAN|nr:c-type cytochrome [Symmachiella macrocystis]TWU09535.1 Cytochrome c [Symmachiella macrocystis]